MMAFWHSLVGSMDSNDSEGDAYWLATIQEDRAESAPPAADLDADR
jgi:hypothetical protein